MKVSLFSAVSCQAEMALKNQCIYFIQVRLRDCEGMICMNSVNFAVTNYIMHTSVCERVHG